MCDCLKQLAEEQSVDCRGVLIPTTKEGVILIPIKYVNGSETNITKGVGYIDRAKFCPICGEKYDR